MLKTINAREIVEKEVVRFGNGSIVYTPKKWIGEKVLVILEEKPVDIKAEVIEALKPYLGNVEGAFLFGSHARGEATEKSDIDVLVVADRRLGIAKTGRVDFLVKTKEGLIEGMKTDPTLFLHQAITEAQPILNGALLEELKATRIKPDFRKFLDSTLSAFKRTKEILGRQQKEFLDTNAPVYSLVLRMKTLFIIQCYKKGIVFSNKGFVQNLIRHGFSEAQAMEFLDVYRAERDDKPAKVKVPVAAAERLFEAAKIEFIKAERLVKG